MIYNKIPAVFSGTSRIAVADPVNYQYDVTQILAISGLVFYDRGNGQVVIAKINE